MLLKIEKLKGARFSRTGLKSPEGEVLQWERTDRVLSCSPGREPVLQPLWVSRMLYKNINHFKMLRCCFTGFIEPARPSYHAHILLVCENSEGRRGLCSRCPSGGSFQKLQKKFQPQVCALMVCTEPRIHYFYKK